MERSASIFKYYGNKFINDKMKKAKKNEEKLKKTRNKINQLSQKDIIDNNISILFSTFNILKSNKMEEKDPNLDSQNKNENEEKYKDSMLSIYINNSQNENEDKKDEKKDEKMEENEEKDNIINNNIINENKKDENDEEDDDMEKKLKSLEKIRKERRRIPKENKLENKKIPLLRNIKINNKTPIPNSQNLSKSSTFPQTSNEQPPQPIYNQIPIYYNPLMQQALDYPTESQIMALQPQEFVNIRQTQEQINLLRRIANAISEDSSRSILSRLIILILLTCLYGWLTYDFYDANGFTLRATTDLFCMATGAFIVLCGLIIQNIYKKINKSKFNNK